MVLQIAAVYGKRPDRPDRIGEDRRRLMAGGFGCRAVARQLVSLVPPCMGWAIKPAVAASGHGGDGASPRSGTTRSNGSARTVCPEVAAKAQDEGCSRRARRRVPIIVARTAVSNATAHV